ncbi:FHA domain-containing protein [candidate division CSSED10-310 bacterium]|uniref:FHA domain-containing protein n=1 Tax=candidate division CSSED10-310 bacterium TaxID=2855610 RepID=A0ABV6YZX0_UNCC1
MIKITVESEGQVVDTFIFDKHEISIGRDNDNHIIIDSLTVSSHHARILKIDNKYWLEDLGSTNGTYLDDQQISTAQLIDNHTISVGNHDLLVHIGAAKKSTFTPIKTVTIDKKKPPEK